MSRTYTARSIVACHGWCRTHPAGGVPIDRMTVLTAEEWLRWFRERLDAKISSHIVGFEVGRKWNLDYQAEIRRAARELNTPRLAIHWLPKDLKQRFAHRLRGHDEV